MHRPSNAARRSPRAVNPLLIAAGVWFGYDGQTPVLRGVSLEIPGAGIVGILGPNGSGKTTLLRIFAGTRRPQRGTMTLDDMPLAVFSRAELARRMAVVPQETHLAFDYTVAEVAIMGRYPHLGAFEIEGPADIAIVDEVLASTGTLHLKDRLFATLSGGEKQRVVIAAALGQIHSTGAAKAAAAGPSTAAQAIDEEVTSSRFLLLDEPTASLDLGYQLEVASLLTRLHDERRLTIVISTHDLSLAGTLCERLVLIRDGVIVASGQTDEVLTPENVQKVYDVDAEILHHPSGHRIVVPVGRTGRREPR
jgi:iron complex transport system ATP-binding protein